MEMGVKSSFVVMAHIVTAGTLEKGQCSWWISVLAKGQGGDIRKNRIGRVADLIGRIVNYSAEQNGQNSAHACRLQPESLMNHPTVYNPDSARRLSFIQICSCTEANEDRPRITVVANHGQSREETCFSSSSLFFRKEKNNNIDKYSS